MARRIVAVGVVLTALAGSVGAMLMLTKPQAAPQAKAEAQQVKAATSKAEPKKKGPERELKPWEFEIGQWGELYQTHRYFFKIESVVSADRLIVFEDASLSTLAWSRNPSAAAAGARVTPVRFVVETSTEGPVEGKRADLTGKWEVADSILLGGSTLFVLRRPQ
jgi:hypothetical protein